ELEAALTLTLSRGERGLEAVQLRFKRRCWIRCGLRSARAKAKTARLRRAVVALAAMALII
ncbi:MAG TPA: hypothetical protein DCP19_08685, partial [Pseudomonas sp.]|nr:hypothetical protein [Pseudomonas sp.]